MPAVINVFNESHSLVKIDEEQKNIINQYKADFTRYEAENKKLKVKAIYDKYVLSPNNLEKEGKITYLPIYMTGLLVSMDDSIDDQFIPAL